MKKNRAFLLLKISLFFAVVSLIGCGLPGGGGGGIAGEVKTLSGKYQSDKNAEKIFIFGQEDYKLFLTKQQFTKSDPFADAEYSVIGTEITFKQVSGEEFQRRGELSADSSSFIWAEHPGETFKKVAQ